MATPPLKITFTSSNTIGTATDGIVYTCENGGKFYTDVWNGANIALNFYDTGDTATTSQISNLKEVSIFFLPEAGKTVAATDVKIRLSTDGITWGAPITTENALENNRTTIRFSAGNYYVKICTSSSKDVSITEIWYISPADECNCFIYKP